MSAAEEIGESNMTNHFDINAFIAMHKRQKLEWERRQPLPVAPRHLSACDRPNGAGSTATGRPNRIEPGNAVRGRVRRARPG